MHVCACRAIRRLHLCVYWVLSCLHVHVYWAHIVFKYMNIGLFFVCRICEEKNGRQRELQRKVMTE